LAVPNQTSSFAGGYWLASRLINLHQLLACPNLSVSLRDRGERGIA
jgi:hypothetical protein